VEIFRNNELFKIGQLEQYGRRLNVEFKGVPKYEDENVTDIVIKLTKKLEVDVRMVTSQ